MHGDCLDLIDYDAMCFFGNIILECDMNPGKPFTFDRVLGDHPEGMALLEKLGVITVEPHDEGANELTVTMHWNVLKRLSYEEAMLVKWGDDWMKYRGRFWHGMNSRSLEYFSLERVMSLKYGRGWRSKRPGLSHEEMMSLAYGDEWPLLDRLLQAGKDSEELERIWERGRDRNLSRSVDESSSESFQWSSE